MGSRRSAVRKARNTLPRNQRKKMNANIDSNFDAPCKILALLSLYLAMAHGWFHTETHAATVPKIHIEDTPIPREERPAVSFAPVVKKVAASVVSVNAPNPAPPPRGLGPHFDDPSFRRFFVFRGGPEDVPPAQPQ